MQQTADNPLRIIQRPKNGDSREAAPHADPEIPGDAHSETAGHLSGDGLLARLLQEQQTLTAVDEFSQAHDGGLPAQAEYYQILLPAAPPREGQQYAFEVDLDRCSGCKACVTACHSLNGLDDHETWRDVGLLVGGTTSNPVMQHVTTACHHCLEPGCMSACPVDAYEKDPVTGIVKHLDDQCFGCQYCTLACPYDVPKYHAGKGIVRKCDMCSDRLADGEAPACVQACPHEAIAIKVVDRQQVVEDAETDHFLPAAPDPQITLPTTHFKSSRVFPRNTLPADYHAVNPQHPHWPLIVMLVLTQLSVGAFILGLFLEGRFDSALVTAFRPLHATTAIAFGLLALAASTLHLGRPQYAFRAIVGLRHSWLSREIVAFGLFAAAATVYAGSLWLQPFSESWTRSLGWTVAATGIVGIFCSIMIYEFTKREFWSFQQTVVKFSLTAAVMGIAAVWLTLSLLVHIADVGAGRELVAIAGPYLSQALLVAAALKLGVEALFFRHLLTRRVTPLRRSARLMLGPLANFTLARFALGLLGGVVMPLFLWNQLVNSSETVDVREAVLVGMLFTACLVGELLERYLFFAACSAPRMPGRLPS